MNVRALGITGSILVVATLAVACGSSTTRSGFGTDTNATTPTGGGDGGASSSSSGFGGGPPPGAAAGGDCALNNGANDPNKDYDGDGYALKDDCNECNTSVNKGAHDIPGNGIDDDCDGTVDNEAALWDTGLDVAGSDPFDGAKAMGLCKKATDDVMWGVIDAKWVMPDGNPLTNMEGVGVLPTLGVNAPQAGATMLALSSGSARDPSDADYKKWTEDGSNDKGYTNGTPPGYPKESPACPGVHTGEAHDGAALQVKIRIPSNVKSFSYQQNFFTWEYPNFICSEFNDFFVAMMDPPPAGLADGNIAFDQDTNPISVNNSLLQVCKSGTYSGKTFPCPLGDSTLAGTGFTGHAATGWLTTTAPVSPKTEVTLLFAIWDSGDGILDSTVLIDDFKWSDDPAPTTATIPSGPN